MTDAYSSFLARKAIMDPMTGIASPPDLPATMNPHQRDIVQWALRRGRAAVFAGTGLGKTYMELVWADEVARFTGKPVLIFAPLAVAAQHVREASKFGLSARIVVAQADVLPGVNVTNYQKMDHFDLSSFGCELKPSYFRQAVKNLAALKRENEQGLFRVIDGDAA